MKLKYYMCGLGSGIILAVLVLMIANKITPESSGNNKDIHETTGSVIAYTTQADVKGTAASDNAVTTAAGTIAATQKTTEGVQDLMAEDSPLIASIMQVLEESRRTFRSLRGLSDQLDRHPESLLRGAPQDPTPEFPAQPAHSPQEKR